MNFSEQFVAQMGRGQPVKLTAEIAQLFLETFRSTGNIRAAAHRAGLHPGSVSRYLDLGRKSRSGPYFDFSEAVTRARGDYMAALASTHHRMAIGGIRRKPLCKVIQTEKGAIQTDEIDRGPSGKDEIVWIEHWQEPDTRAMEWEMRFLDRDTYGDEGGTAGEPGATVADTMHQAGQVVGVFAAALELMSQYRVTPALMGPAIETTAKPVEE